MKLFAAVSFLALAASASAFVPTTGTVSFVARHNTALSMSSTVAEEVKLYVGNLSWDTDPDTLGDVFSEFGEVTDVFLPTDRDSGRPRGFGFVTIAGREAAEAAMDAMDGMELDGRDIRCNESTSKPQRNSNKGPAGPFNAAGAAEVRLYVGNLSFDSTEESIRDAFASFGTVTDLLIPTDRETGESRGFAFVTMAAEEAEAALEMDGAEIDGRYVRVNESLPKPERNNNRGGEFNRGPTGPFNAAGNAEVKLYVGNLSFDSSEDSIREAFASYGTITDCFVPTDRDTGRVRGFAFVTMAAEEAENALALDGAEIDGRAVRVNESLPKAPRD